MKFRIAQLSDAAAISELVYTTSMACCFSADQPCPEWFKESISHTNIATHIEAGSISYVLAEINSTIVGVLGISDRNKIKYFFVSPVMQGSGVGKKIWQFAREQSLLDTVITVRSSLVAVPVYEQLGFLVIEEPKVFNGLHYQNMVAHVT